MNSSRRQSAVAAAAVPGRRRWQQLPLLFLGAASLLLSLASADVSFEGNVPARLAMGQAYTVRWTTDADSVKVTLVSGSEGAGDINHVYDVVCGVWIVNDLDRACDSTDTTAEWTPGDSLPLGSYMLMANAADESTDYSNRFSLVAEGDGDTTTSGSSGTTTAPSGASTFTSVFTSTSGTSAQVITSVITGAPGSTADPGSGSGSGSDDSSSNGGMTTGAKIGVGVGAGVGGLLILGALGFLLFRMGKRAADHKEKEKEKADAAAAAAGDGKTDGGGDLDESGSRAATAVASADSAGKAEEGEAGVVELQAPIKIHEAPDYRTRLETPTEFVSELDATGGLFVIPPNMSRPTTGDAAAEEADKDKATAEGEEGKKADGETATTAAAGANNKNESGEKTPGEEEAAAGASSSKNENDGEKASSSSEEAKKEPSVIYETPDDIGRPPDK